MSMYLDSEGKTRLISLNVDRPFAESVRRKTERTNKMKKLMIAAAAAAMVSGAFASPTAVYYFRADLRTTGGNFHEADKVADAEQAGINAAGQFWYDAPALRAVTTDLYDAGGVLTSRVWNAGVAANFPHLKWVVAESFGGQPFPDLQIVREPNKNYDVLDLTESTLIHGIRNAGYNRKSAGVWCLDLSWYTENAGICYRQTGIEYISREVTLELATDCCGAGRVNLFQFLDKDNGVQAIWGNGNNPAGGFLHRFGSWDSDKANFIEFFAQVAAPVEIEGLNFNGWLAGQGSVLVNTIPDKDKNPVEAKFNVPTSASGMIVGYMEPTKCIDCCVSAPDSIVFTCLDGTTPTTGRHTAAYGTFSLTFQRYE